MDFRQRPWPAERRRRRNGPRPPIRRRHVILNARNLPPAITASRRERRRRRNGPCPPTRRRHIILNARSLPPARTLNRKTSAVDTEVQPLEVGGVRETTVLAKEDNQDHNEQVPDARDASPGPVETETEVGVATSGELPRLAPGPIAKSPFERLSTEVLNKQLKYVCSVVSFMKLCYRTRDLDMANAKRAGMTQVRVLRLAMQERLYARVRVDQGLVPKEDAFYF
jgi:hypothetical protein